MTDIAEAPARAAISEPRTDDLLGTRFPHDPNSPRAASSAARIATVAAKARNGLPPITYVLAAITVVMLLWAAWVTKRIADPAVVKSPIASVRLEAIVSEYVQAQSHTSSSSDVVTRQTGQFMAALDAELKRRGADGTTVLVGEAVLSQNVPDITADIRKAIYARVPLPVAGPAPTLGAAAPVVVPGMPAPSAPVAMMSNPSPFGAVPAGSPLDPGLAQPQEDAGRGYAN